MTGMGRYAAHSLLFVLLILAAPCAKGGDAMAFTLKCPDFREGDVIPKTHTCEGDDISPELAWENPPEGTESFVLVVEDPDAPGKTFTHWVVYDMPATYKHMEQGFGNDEPHEGDMKQGKNDFGFSAYGGPCPPTGHGRHRYYFKVMALDVPSLGLPHGAGLPEVLDAAQDHVLGEAQTMGVFER